MALVIILSLLALIFIFSEIFLIPGFGVAGVLGILSMCGSSYFAYHEYGTLVGTIVVVINILSVAVLIFCSFRAKTWKRLSLETKIASKAVVEEYQNVKVGDVGLAMTRLAPAGTVKFDNVSVEARSYNDIISSGAEVEVVLIEDNKIYVKQL
jgi:membrane-bound ClpP family serine protease